MRVLVVVASRADREDLARALEAVGTIEIIEAADGASALTAWDDDRPDLVLSDWRLADMTGRELLERLRAEDPDVRLGFVSAHAQPHVAEEARAAGALFLVERPTTAEAFHDVLDRVF